MSRLKELLLVQRKEIFERLRQFETDWQALEEPEIELEEEARKSVLTSLFDQLVEYGKEGIEEIEISCRNGLVHL